MSKPLEEKVKSITEKLLASRKKHVGDKKSNSHSAKKIARSLEDSLRGKDDVLSQASHSQKLVLDRVMMETFEFLGDPEKENEGYKKILLEQLERIHAVNDKNASPEAEKEIIKIIEKQIQASKEVKMPDLGIGKLIGGVFFNEEFFKDIDKLGDKFEKMISGGGLFGSTKKQMEQATLRGKAAKEMKDMGVHDPFYNKRHADEDYYRQRRYDRNNAKENFHEHGGYSSQPSSNSTGSHQTAPQGVSNGSPMSGSGVVQKTHTTPLSEQTHPNKVQTEGGQSKFRPRDFDQGVVDVEARLKPDVDELQSSYKMKSDSGVVDVSPKEFKGKGFDSSGQSRQETLLLGRGDIHTNVSNHASNPLSNVYDQRQSTSVSHHTVGQDVSPKEIKIDKLNVEKLIVKSMDFQGKKDRAKSSASKPEKPKSKTMMGQDRKQSVTDAIIKREIPARLEGLKDNEGDKLEQDAGKSDQNGSGGVLDALSDASLAKTSGKLLGGAANLAKAAAPYALPAAAMVAAGAGADAIAGKLGVGGKEIDAKQDDDNWNRMTWTQKIESGLARGTEKVGSALFLDNISNEAKAKRIKNETEYLNKAPEVSVGNASAKSLDSAANQVEKAGDDRLTQNQGGGTTVIDASTHTTTGGNSEKKTDIPPSPASSRPTESSFNYWQRNVFLK